MNGRVVSPRLPLRQLAPGIDLWRRGSNGGIIQVEDGGLLIDTGSDATAAAALLAEVQNRRWRHVVIVNTHHHHDHVAGNALLVERAGAVVWSPGSPVDASLWPVLGSLEVMAVPGHTSDSLAVRTGSVLWVGDAVYAPEVRRRYPIPAYEDVAVALDSLRRIARWLAGDDIAWLVAGHGRPLTRSDAAAVIAENQQGVEGALAVLARCWRSPLDRELTLRWLEAAGASPPANERLVLYWQRVASAYARELVRRGRISADEAGLAGYNSTTGETSN
ncbi:MAG TPA: MBL fold metallo-hydrolase [Bacillota bacterium]